MMTRSCIDLTPANSTIMQIDTNTGEVAGRCIEFIAFTQPARRPRIQPPKNTIGKPHTMYHSPTML